MARPSPVEGKTYEVEATAAGIEVKRGGAFAPPSEAALVRDDYGGLGHPDPVLSSIPTRPIAMGDEVPAVGEALRAILSRGTGPDIAVEDARARLVDREQRDGAKVFVFEITVRLASGPEPIRARSTLKGTIAIREDGAPAEIALEGPIAIVTASPLADSATVTGTGTLRMRVLASYVPAAAPSGSK
jgi:hypothetical protein